jgi:hypothetical protein
MLGVRFPLLIVSFPLLVASCAPMPVVDEAPLLEALDPVLQPPEGRFLKRKVIVERFSNETRYGKSALIGEDLIANQASDVLKARLTQSGKFLLFDAEGAQAGVVEPDFKIVGSVSEFGRSTSSGVGVFDKNKTQLARAAVNLRVVDARTGLVIFSAEGRGESSLTNERVLGIGRSSGYDSTLDERAISAAISNVVGAVAERLLDAPWRSSVLQVEGTTAMIGGGARQGLMEGDQLRILKKGKRITNPQTGGQVELPGTEIARVRVVSCHGTSYADEFSVAEVLSGSLEGLSLDLLTVRDKGE